MDVFDFVELEIFQDAAAFHFDDFTLVVHEVVNGEIFLERIIDPVEATLAEAGKIKRRLAQSLAWDSARIDATAAGIRGPLDNGNTFSEIRGLRSSFFSGWPATNHNEVERIVGCQRCLHATFQKGCTKTSLEE